MVSELILALRRVGSDEYLADHFTKILPLVPFRSHTSYMMGIRFFTKAHLRHMLIPEDVIAIIEDGMKTKLI